MGALNPAETNYLYYVRNPDRDDGAHNFYSNSRDFEAGVQALRKWEQERDSENALKKSGTSSTP
jgi:cell division protein YceG involved in septum cleavage